MDKNSMISVIIPCYRSAGTIRDVIAGIDETMATRPEIRYEVILVNDGSPDNTFEVIADIARHNEHVKAVNLSRNFGQHSALMAAYSQAQGDYILGMDDDNEHDPHDMFKLIDELEKGYDYVCARFPETDRSLYKKLGSKFNDWMATRFIGKPKDALFSSYYVMRSYVMKEIIKSKNPKPYVGGMIVNVTKKLTSVPIPLHSRTVGQSGYNFRNSFNLLFNGLTGFSIAPLRMASYAGVFCAIIGFLACFITILRKIFVPSVLIGYSSTISLMLAIGGVIMFLLGIVGEYVGRIYMLLNEIPQYVIKEIITKNEVSADMVRRLDKKDA